MDYRTIANKNQILKVRVGSHLFGTSTSESDEDFEGIFMPDRSLVFGFGRCREVDFGVVDKDESGRNTSDAVDYKVREYRDFCRLALQNNPNILNVLFANDENTLVCDEFGKRLKEMACYFPHMGCVQRYVGYATSQLKKMEIKPVNHKMLSVALGILSEFDRTSLLYEAVEKTPKLVNGVAVFNDLGPGKHIKIGDIMIERGVKVKKALRTISGRLERASARAENWEKYGYDTKFASNLIQILMQGKELLYSGMLSFPLGDADTILGIKRGMYTLDMVKDLANSLKVEVAVIEKAKRLPSKPRYKEVEDFVIREVNEWMLQKE